MGIEKMNVTAKLEAEVVSRIDGLVERFRPFCEGRSSMMRILLKVAIAGIDAGKIPNTMSGLQNYLRRKEGGK